MSRMAEQYALPYGVFPGDMSSTDMDSILQEISNQMANSPLVRPESIHSNGTSSSFRRRAARTIKTNSAGNSPHGIERRKSTASHFIARHISNPENRCVRTLSSGRATTQRSKRPIISERPTTWHPSSIMSDLPGYTSTTFRNLAAASIIEGRMSDYHLSEVDGPPALVTQAHMDCNVPLNPYGDLGAWFAVDDQSRIPFSDHQSFLFDDSGPTYPSEANGYINQSNYPHMPPFQEPLTYARPTCPARDWTQVASAELPRTSAHPVPEYPPVRYSTTKRENSDTVLSPRLLKEHSKELVGMGLYDSPDRGSNSILTSGDDSGIAQFYNNLHPRQESVGKGLKLEETWQPPVQRNENEDEDEDEDEAYSTDEGEEEPLSGPGFTATDQQRAPNHFYGDLSDQTFLFDPEDNYPNDIAFDQNISVAGYKALDAAMEHATWI